MDRLTYPDIARIFGTGLISTGLGLLLFVLVTIFWGDPFTRLSESGEQDKLERAFAEFAPAQDELRTAALDPELTRDTAALARKRSPLGAPMGKMRIPKIGLSKIIVHGARDGTTDLEKGPGIYKEVTFPGSGAPIAIAGHRTTYGAPFLHIDRLRPGDKIIVTVPYGEFTYTVSRQPHVISPNDWSILNPGAGEPTQAMRQQVQRTGNCVSDTPGGDTCEHLVLTACHPKYSAAKRLAVFAKLTGVKLDEAGAAAA
jgi:sortase A